VLRLHHRHAAGQSLQYINALGFRIRRRHGEDIDRIEHLQLLGAIDLAEKRDRIGKFGLHQAAEKPLGPFLIPAAEIAGDLELRLAHPRQLDQLGHRLQHLIETLFGTNPRQVSNRRRATQ